VAYQCIPYVIVITSESLGRESRWLESPSACVLLFLALFQPSSFVGVVPSSALLLPQHYSFFSITPSSALLLPFLPKHPSHHQRLFTSEHASRSPLVSRLDIPFLLRVLIMSSSSLRASTSLHIASHSIQHHSPVSKLSSPSPSSKGIQVIEPCATATIKHGSPNALSPRGRL
jgi:hypothetical protein